MTKTNETNFTLKNLRRNSVERLETPPAPQENSEIPPPRKSTSKSHRKQKVTSKHDDYLKKCAKIGTQQVGMKRGEQQKLTRRVRAGARAVRFPPTDRFFSIAGADAENLISFRKPGWTLTRAVGLVEASIERMESACVKNHWRSAQGK